MDEDLKEAVINLTSSVDNLSENLQETQSDFNDQIEILVSAIDRLTEAINNRKF